MSQTSSSSPQTSPYPPGYHGGYVDPNWPDPQGPLDAPLIIYGYKPSLGLAYTGITIFAILFIAHIFQVLRLRTWYFIPVVVGCAFEVVGYVFRSFSARLDPYNIQYFVLQYTFIILAPVLASASIYALLSVLISRVGRVYSPIPPRAVLIFFVVADLLATAVQLVGSALIGVRESHHEDPSHANTILLVGLCLQLVSFVAFIALAGLFAFRAAAVLFPSCVTTTRTTKRVAEDQDRSQDSLSSPPAPNAAEKRDQPCPAAPLVPLAFLLSAATATLAVLLRTCYRTSETAQRGYGSAAKGVTEAKFAGLEFAPVVVWFALLAVWHPGRCLKAPVPVMPSNV